MYYTHKELQFEHDYFVLYGSMKIVSILSGVLLLGLEIVQDGTFTRSGTVIGHTILFIK